MKIWNCICSLWYSVFDGRVKMKEVTEVFLSGELVHTLTFQKPFDFVAFNRGKGT